MKWIESLKKLWYKWWYKPKLKILNSNPKKSLLDIDYFTEEEMNENWNKIFKELQKDKEEGSDEV